MRRALPVALAIAVGAILSTWPLALDPTGSLLGTPGLEAVDHLWTLWLALFDGPLVIHTTRVGFPEGYTWVLADPANLPAFAVGHLLAGPAFGFHLVHLVDLALAGLGAVALGQAFLPAEQRLPWFAALVATTLPAMAGGLFTGMTEAQTFGLVALALAALHRALQPEAGPRAILLAGLAAGATAWGGPYSALYFAFAALPVALAAPRRAGRLLAAALLGGLLAAPILWAISTQRDPNLPGASSLTAAVMAQPSLPQNRMLGADLAQIFLPRHSEVQADLHAVYLGMVVWALALVGLVRRRPPWTLLVALVALLSLGLGFFVQIGGWIPTTADGRVFLAPAGWLSLWIEGLGRAPRWYRAVAVGGLLLAPLAAAGARRLSERLPLRARTPVLLLLATLVLVDALGLSPLPWPRDSFPARPPAAYAELDGDGPIVEVPHVRFSTIVSAGKPVTASGGGVRLPDEPIRHPALLWQTFHGHALGGNPHQPGAPRAKDEVSLAVDALADAAKARDPAAAAAARATLAELGFTWVLHHPSTGPAALTKGLPLVLGPAPVSSEALQAWPLP